MARREAPVIPDELLDRLLAGRDPQAARCIGRRRAWPPWPAT
jgi:hypothetical protein